MDRVDLHIHSTCSDGELSVDEIFEQAEKQGLEMIGFIDHDTTKQFDVVYGSKYYKEGKIKVLVGTEFSCKLGDKKMHILGYNFDHKSKEIARLIDEMKRLRRQKLLDKLEILKAYGIELKSEQIEHLMSIENVGNPHIAKCMLENGVEGDIGSIIRKYLKGKHDKTKSYKLNVEEVIKAVHDAGGFVVMAHPYQIGQDNHLSEQEERKVWKDLVDLKIDGMECFYSLYDEKQIKTLVNFALENKLKISYGSDFHGKNVKPNIKLGQIFLS